MAKLSFIMNTSLDGYIEDASGAFDWSDPGPVFDPITEMLRPIGTYLYGRRIYQTMSPYWDADIETYPPEQREFARVWQRAEKIVFSRTLSGGTMRNTRFERDFDVEAIRKLKEQSPHDIAIAGAELAGIALDAGLLDECHLLLHPVVVGGGKPALQASSRRNLELVEVRRLETVVHVHYRIGGAS